MQLCKTLATESLPENVDFAEGESCPILVSHNVRRRHLAAFEQGDLSPLVTGSFIFPPVLKPQWPSPI